MKRYFLQCSFHGQAYVGWQKQPNKSTIQKNLDYCLSTALQEEIEVMGAGRTDTGVHAKFFIAHFDTKNDIQKNKNLIYKLNTLLPKDIAVQNIFKVKQDNHARFDAVKRSYQYRITTSKNPFEIDSAYYIKNKLDVHKMQTCAQELYKHTNFKSFSKVKTDVKTYNCNILEAKVTKMDNLILFSITANRFLRNMVRSITGTLIDVGLNRSTTEEFKRIVQSQDRRNAGKSVPAKGLYLTNIVYPYELISIYAKK